MVVHVVVNVIVEVLTRFRTIVIKEIEQPGESRRRRARRRVVEAMMVVMRGGWLMRSKALGSEMA